MARPKFGIDEAYPGELSGKGPLAMEGRYNFLPIMDKPTSVYNPNTGKNEYQMSGKSLALPGFVAGVYNAFTAPGRSMTDQNFNAPEEAVNMGLNLMGMGTAFGAAPKGSLGMFIGRNAKNYDLAAEASALEMKKTGISKEDIKRLTGVSFIPQRVNIYDKNKVVVGNKIEEIPVQEISDYKSKFTETGYPLKEFTTDAKPHEYDLEKIINHPELFENYPFLKDITAIAEDDPRYNGSYSPYGKILKAGGESQKPVRLPSGEYDPYFMDKTRSTILHEIQHAIQGYEGWPEGGNIERIKQDINDVRRQELGTQELQNNQASRSRLYMKMGMANDAMYLDKLDKLTRKDNIKPREITNLSDFYKYRDQIYSAAGKRPKRAGYERDQWNRTAAKIIYNKFKEENPDKFYYANNYDVAKAKKDYKNANAKLSGKNTTELNKKFFDVKEKYNSFDRLSPFEQYQSLFGEAQSRAVQNRMDLHPEALRNTPVEDSYTFTGGIDEGKKIPLKEMLIKYR